MRRIAIADGDAFGKIEGIVEAEFELAAQGHLLPQFRSWKVYIADRKPPYPP
jgi:hypothetical protein